MSSPVEVARKGASRVGSPVEEGNEARKDSGLESCEMSDCSEDGGERIFTLIRLSNEVLEAGVSKFQRCGSESGIRSLFDPWIRNPGWVKNQDSDPG